MKTMEMTIYADNTGMFSEKELNDCNLTEMTFPEEIIRKWYDEHEELREETAHELDIPESEATFERWYKEVSWAQDVDGLYDYALDNGYTPTFNVGGNFAVQYDKGGRSHVLFEGSFDDCMVYRRDRDFIFQDSDDEYDLEVVKKKGAKMEVFIVYFTDQKPLRKKYDNWDDALYDIEFVAAHGRVYTDDLTACVEVKHYEVFF